MVGTEEAVLDKVNPSSSALTTPDSSSSLGDQTGILPSSTWGLNFGPSACRAGAQPQSKETSSHQGT